MRWHTSVPIPDRTIAEPLLLTILLTRAYVKRLVMKEIVGANKEFEGITPPTLEEMRGKNFSKQQMCFFRMFAGRRRT